MAANQHGIQAPPVQDDPDSVENLVADLAVDGREIRELSFREINELRGHWKGWARDLLGMGLDHDGTKRLLSLAQEYGLVKRANLVDINDPSEVVGLTQSSRFERAHSGIASGKSAAGRAVVDAEYRGTLAGAPRKALQIGGLVH